MLLTAYKNIVTAVLYSLSIPLLLRTFFAPWKRYEWRRSTRGFNVADELGTALSNLISRLIGMFIRSLALTIAFIVLIATIVFSPIILLFTLLVSPKNPLFRMSFQKRDRAFAWDWHFGYTPLLDPYARELYYEPLTHPLVGTEQHFIEVERILSQKTGQNILLVGEPGSGRHALLTSLSKKFITYRFLVFDVTSYFKEYKSSDSQAAALQSILQEALNAGNVIIVFGNFEQLTPFASVLDPYLDNPSLHIIGITTPAIYHKTLLPNKQLMKYFTPVEVSPPTREQLVLILTSRAQTAFSPALSPDIITSLADASYTLATIEGKGQPEAGITLLEEFTAAYRQTTKDKKSKLDSPEFLRTFLSERLHVPFASPLGTDDKDRLRHLEELLHERVINQYPAITHIANALRRRRLQLSDTKKPIGSFLFLGPTGVGKTETAKALAAIVFEDEKRLMRFDMAQYQQQAQISQLTDELARSVREMPYGVLLLDEIEKAHHDLLNLFLTITDEGYFHDTNGNKVLCNQLIIIGTSNAGSEYIRELTQNEENRSEEDDFQRKITGYVLSKGIFTPEFINRFDAVVVYVPLTDYQLKEITRMKLVNIQQSLKEHHGKELPITEELISNIVDAMKQREFGARELDRTIKRVVLDPLANELLQ